MKTAVINIKVDPELKAKAQKRAKELGVPLSYVLHTQLVNFTRGEKVEILAEDTNQHLDNLIKESLSSGTVGPFDTAEDAVEYLTKA